MGYYIFEKPTVFKNSKELRECFSLDSVYIEDGSEVTFNGEISLNENVYFKKNCFFDSGTSIDVGCVLSQINTGKRVIIRPYSIINDSIFGNDNLLGPFCFIRNNTRVFNECIIGNNVEAVRSTIYSGVKISHQAYIGDATINENSIIGSNTVFCNFNGIEHETSLIGKNVLVGSGTMIIAPVEIGDNSIIAAGSIVNKDIPSNTKFIVPRK
tara:strand:- start:1916 stop:2551 length:636 start_codon:yes stop_codon:yes gene_type:complete